MLSYIQSYFTTINHDPSLEHTKKNKSKYIHRDELDKKATPLNNLRRRAHRKTVDTRSPLLQGEVDQEDEKRVLDGEAEEVNEEKKGIRVKVRMTKDEAIRLLSKCKEGGLLEFSDVAHELSRIPTNRIRIVDTSIVGDQVLNSIPE